MKLRKAMLLHILFLTIFLSGDLTTLSSKLRQFYHRNTIESLNNS